MSNLDQVRKRFLEAVAGTDVKAVVDCYHPDAVLTAPEGRYEGRDYIEAFYRLQFKAFPDGRLKVTATHDGESTAIAEWSFTGTNTGPLELAAGQTLPPTGRRVTQRGSDFAVVRDGRIVEHRVYYDQLEAFEQLGLEAVVRG